MKRHLLLKNIELRVEEKESKNYGRDFLDNQSC